MNKITQAERDAIQAKADTLYPAVGFEGTVLVLMNHLCISKQRAQTHAARARLKRNRPTKR